MCASVVVIVVIVEDWCDSAASEMLRVQLERERRRHVSDSREHEVMSKDEQWERGFQDLSRTTKAVWRMWTRPVVVKRESAAAKSGRVGQT